MTALIERFKDWLPVTDATPIISLSEGSTPLIEAPRLAKQIGEGRRVYLKFEGVNPTGSFKDRGMTLAVSKAAEKGTSGIICASTGNTSASAAAYAARAGIPCWVLLPIGNVALGKLAQACAHGARTIAIDGNFDEALALVRKVTENRALTMVNSLNPYRIEGQKTAAFEIFEDLGAPPDLHCLPVGNAGNITANWRGYVEACERKKISRRPMMYGFQAEGAAPIVLGRPVENPETIASAIRIGNPASWKGATAAAGDSGGNIDSVTDAQILAAYKRLASEEGVFCEPASAASVAGLLKLARHDRVPAPPGGTIVCTLTGHGLKDPDRAIATNRAPVEVPADLKSLLEIMDRA